MALSIIITPEGGHFNVQQGGQVSKGLGWDELLGQIASLTHPDIKAGLFGMSKTGSAAPAADRVVPGPAETASPSGTPELDLKAAMARHHGRWRYFDGTYHIFTALPEQALDRIGELEEQLEDAKAAAGGPPARVLQGGPWVNVPIELAQARALSEGLADLLCWLRGYSAASDPLRGDGPLGVDEARSVRILLRSAIQDATGERDGEIGF
ncbi:hypothetical protein [Methylobacterium aquaticum]|uniref:Uncharacterized protein n=1 Tax=Methylobacterium aquaticum TaxID=270351 RepID=A0A0C6FP22_9HYPH|nr:hypothetical protein [Methylobacterium aquaticum]BAQ44360.1 hypothetical protein Maq22A_c04765 [Methylobacterium aquaticum]